MSVKLGPDVCKILSSAELLGVPGLEGVFSPMGGENREPVYRETIYQGRSPFTSLITTCVVGAVTAGAGGGGAEVVTLGPTQGWRRGREGAVTGPGKRDCVRAASA